MKLLVSLSAVAVLLSTIAVHPQPYDRGPPPPDAFARDYPPPPLDEDGPPPRRMICIIDTPFPDHQERCPTHAGYPGSPCRCEGALFEGVRDFVD